MSIPNPPKGRTEVEGIGVFEENSKNLQLAFIIQKLIKLSLIICAISTWIIFIIVMWLEYYTNK